jgi:hypothetical protein
MGDIQSGIQDFRAAWRLLANDWNDVSTTWRDAVAAQFERDFWSNIDREVGQMLKVMEQFSDNVQRIERTM